MCLYSVILRSYSRHKYSRPVAGRVVGGKSSKGYTRAVFHRRGTPVASWARHPCLIRVRLPGCPTCPTYITSAISRAWVEIERVTALQLTRTASLVLIAAAALAYNALDSTALGSGLVAFSGLLYVSPTSLSLDVLLMLGGAVALVPWAPSTSPATARNAVNTYPLFVIFTTIGGTCLVASADLVTLYLAIELQSFALYVITAVLNRDSESATHAGLLYFMLGGLSSSVIVLGSALLYSQTGHTSFEAIMAMAATDSAGLSPTALGLTLLAVGLLFKITAAPFHNWGPDVYDGVPTMAATWLAVLPKVSILGLLLVLQVGLGGTALRKITAGLDYDPWQALLLVTSFLSLVVGTVVGLAQVRIKRLLAYSTVSHVGFLLMALAVHSEEATEAYLLYLGQYTATALAAFMTLLALGYVTAGRDVSTIKELIGVHRTHPLLAMSLTVCLLSMAGIPPLVGFYGKQGVMYAAIGAGYTYLVIVAIVASIISATYYLRVVRAVAVETSTSPTPTNTQVVDVPVTAVHSYATALITTALVLFMVTPDLVLHSTRLVALSLYGA